MRNCPKCGRGQLLFDRSPNRYKIIYYCNRCGEETVIHITQEEMMDPNTKQYKTIRQVICPKCKTIIDI